MNVFSGALFFVGLTALTLVGCAESESLGIEATGNLAVSVAALEYPGVFGATYTIAVYEQDGTRIWLENLDSAQYGAPNGSLLYVGPCVAGAEGAATNTVIVKVTDVYDADGTVNGLRLPPAASIEVVCTENADVAATFNFVVARSAEHGFTDITVDIDDIFCAAKVDCQDALMPHPETGERGPTLVTGFSCTGGNDTVAADNYVGFEAELCCGADTNCTVVSIGAAGQPEWTSNGFGVVDTQSYFGAEDAEGRIYHNTSWLLDPQADGLEGCTLSGFGFFNSDRQQAPAQVWNAGDPAHGVGASPAFHFFASVGADLSCTPGEDAGVEWNFSPQRGPDEEAQPPGGTSSPGDER